MQGLPGAFEVDLTRVQSNVGRERHEAAVQRAIEYIHAGDAIQVVLSQRLQRQITADSFTLYRALRTVSPSPYMVYMNFGPYALVGASVETLLKVTGDRLYYHPIAGTRRRGATRKRTRRSRKSCAMTRRSGPST